MPTVRLSKCRPSWSAFFIRNHMAPTAWCMAPATWCICSLPREHEYGGHCGGRCDRGCPRARANRAFAGRQAGNPRQYWAGGQGGRKRPFHAGFRACLPATSNPRRLQADHGERRSVPPCLSHRCPPLPGALHLAIAQKRVPRQSCMIACLPNHCAKLIFTIIRHVTHPAPRRSGRPARHA